MGLSRDYPNTKLIQLQAMGGLLTGPIILTDSRTEVYYAPWYDCYPILDNYNPANEVMSKETRLGMFKSTNKWIVLSDKRTCEIFELEMK